MKFPALFCLLKQSYCRNSDIVPFKLARLYPKLVSILRTESFPLSMKTLLKRVNGTNRQSFPVTLSWLVFVFLTLATARSLYADPVRDVDFSDAPDMEKFAGETRKFCNELYPQILKLLTDDASKVPQQFDLIIKKEQSVPGMASGTTIYLSAAWFIKNPTDLGAIVHEMTHVAQHYAPGAPGYWTEGIADYVRYTLGYTNSWSYPHCAAQFPHYTSGYWCTSAFLMYIDAKYGSKIVLGLNSALRQQGYSDDYFEKATGKKIDDLWAEFQKTAAFQHSAAQALKKQDSLAKSDKEECTAHLKLIHQAVEAYQKKNHKLPDWLSDLVPDYIADTNALSCPSPGALKRLKTSESSTHI